MPNVRTLVAGALLGSLALAACGSDDDSGGADTAAFCDRLADTPAEEASDEEVLANIEELAAAAPSEIADDMNELATLFAQAQDIDLETADEQTLGDFDELLARFNEVSTATEDWARENCPDLPDDFFSTGG